MFDLAERVTKSLAFYLLTQIKKTVKTDFSKTYKEVLDRNTNTHYEMMT